MKIAQQVLFAGFALMAGTVAASASSTIVAPNANASSAGNSFNTLPTASVSQEFQELVGSGQLPPGQITVTAISFRAAPNKGAISATIGSLSVNLSTSPNYPNTNTVGGTLMSSTFASNVGPDKTLVYSGSNVVWSDAGCSGSGPCPFDINIVFTTPFTYNPNNGRLLIDLTETNFAAKSGATDAASFTGPPGGSVAQVTGTAGSAMGTFSYQGNIVQITYTVAPGTPQFTGVVNPASNIPPGFPNSGLAQGSIFVVYGSNLGPAALVQATALPFPLTLGGTTITINVNGTITTAPIDYTSAGQVAAVLPSNTPVGSGTLTLTYNNISWSTSITVVQSNFGISTVNESGSGAAVVTFTNYSVVSPTNSAKPGDTLVLWGTGLGPLPAGQSDAAGAVGGNIAVPIQVLVGGVSATIQYQGRTPTAVGLDQINFIVPLTAPLGCAVSIIVQTTTPATVSNGPTMSLAATDGATCTDPTQIIPTSYLTKSSVKAAYLNINVNSFLNGFTGPGNNPSTTTSLQASAGFLQFTQAQLAASSVVTNAEPTLGSCVMGIVVGNGSGGGGPVATYLNAGSSVTLTPPSGPPVILSPQTAGVQIVYQNSTLSTAPSGTWGFSNTGGSDVGPLNFNFPIPAQVTWTNQTSLSTGAAIDHTQPLTITWAGGDSNGYVDIQGEGQIGPSNAPTYTSYFHCSAPTSAGSFSIPPAAMSGIPTGANAFAGLQVSTNAFPLTLPAISGFDVGVDASSFQTVIPVIFK